MVKKNDRDETQRQMDYLLNIYEEISEPSLNSRKSLNSQSISSNSQSMSSSSRSFGSSRFSSDRDYDNNSRRDSDTNDNSIDYEYVSFQPKFTPKEREMNKSKL
jgi:hypothetical protein